MKTINNLQILKVIPMYNINIRVNQHRDYVFNMLYPDKLSGQDRELEALGCGVKATQTMGLLSLFKLIIMLGISDELGVTFSTISTILKEKDVMYQSHVIEVIRLDEFELFLTYKHPFCLFLLLIPKALGLPHLAISSRS